MIEKTTAYRVGQQFFQSILDAQRHELALVFQSLRMPCDQGEKPMPQFSEDVCLTMADAVIDNANKILDVLTMTPTSKPRARKINGGTKKRAPKPATPRAYETATKQ